MRLLGFCKEAWVLTFLQRALENRDLPYELLSEEPLVMVTLSAVHSMILSPHL